MWDKSWDDLKAMTNDVKCYGTDDGLDELGFFHGRENAIHEGMLLIAADSEGNVYLIHQML